MKTMRATDYGKELILDMHNCNTSRMDQKNIQDFFDLLCERIDMKQMDSHFWKETKGEDHIIGTSAVQFIRTSNITIHALPKLKAVYLNIFSCKEFNEKIAVEFCEDFFDGVATKNTLAFRS